MRAIGRSYSNHNHNHNPIRNLTYSQQLPCSVVVHVLSLANDRSIVCRSTREADVPGTMDEAESTTAMVDADTAAADSMSLIADSTIAD